MRSSTLRASASLVLVLLAGSLAPARADGPAAPAAQDKTAQPDTTAQPGAKTAPPARAEPAKAEPAKAAQPPAQSKPPGTAATVVSLKTIEGIMGKSVRSRTGNEDMGHIVDVLVDGNGETRAAVIDFGGFLGVGSRKVAVAWKTLDFADSIQSGSVKLNLTRDQVRQAPEYKPDEPIVILEGAALPKPPAPPAPPAGHNQDSPPR